MNEGVVGVMYMYAGVMLIAFLYALYLKWQDRRKREQASKSDKKG